MMVTRSTHLGMPDPSHSSLPTWTPEREARTLRLFLSEGFTAAEVADALGGDVTRAAVIGKVRRLGFRKRDCGPPAERVRPAACPSRVERRLPPRRPPLPMPELRDVAATGEPCRLACLPVGACHWPIDDPGPGRMHATLFCAGPTQDGVYCAAHRALAHAP
jgi:GcrA cell cycle regulator